MDVVDVRHMERRTDGRMDVKDVLVVGLVRLVGYMDARKDPRKERNHGG